MDDPSCTRDPRAFWPKYSSCPLISAHEFWQSIRPRWYHCYNFAFLSRLVPICKNVFQNYYFYSYLLYIFMLSLFILSSELLNSRSLWRLHFFCSSWISQWLVSNFIPTDSKKFGFRNFDWIIRFAIKNESEIEKFRSRD